MKRNRNLVLYATFPWNGWFENYLAILSTPVSFTPWFPVVPSVHAPPEDTPHPQNPTQGQVADEAHVNQKEGQTEAAD